MIELHIVGDESKRSCVVVTDPTEYNRIEHGDIATIRLTQGDTTLRHALNAEEVAHLVMELCRRYSAHEEAQEQAELDALVKPPSIADLLSR